MNVRIRGEEGKMLKLDSMVSGGRNATTCQMTYSIDAYQVTIVQDHGKEITFKCVYPHEIEYIGPRSSHYKPEYNPDKEKSDGL